MIKNLKLKILQCNVLCWKGLGAIPGIGAVVKGKTFRTFQRWELDKARGLIISVFTLHIGAFFSRFSLLLPYQNCPW